MLVALHRQRWISLISAFLALTLIISTISASADDLPEARTTQAETEAQLLLTASPGTWPIPPGSAAKPMRDTSEVKRLARAAATAHAVPIDYFLRLINQESGFNERAVSRAGALGIAQFMPNTAAMRGLKDPFDPAEALPKSAAFLGELTRQFGNVGLAAAAYNCGANCVANWLAGRGRMPLETRGYVLAITGRAVQDWAPADVRLRDAVSGHTLAFSDPARRTKIYQPTNWELDLLRSINASALPPGSLIQSKLQLAVSKTDRGVPRNHRLSRAGLESVLCSTCLIRSTY